MPDWREYVRGQLIAASNYRPVDEDVVTELAEHLEQVYVELRTSGLSNAEALQQARKQAGNWTELRRGIELARQEGVMQVGVRQFWLPSLVTLFSAFAALAILIWAGVQPWMTHPAEPRGLVVYVPWMLVLPFIGAAGAYLSRRAQATPWKVYVAGAFPAFAIALLFLMILPWGFVVDPQVVPAFRLRGLAAGTISWVILPGIALCLGITIQGKLMAQGQNRESGKA
jgi:hypothetical protein